MWTEDLTKALPMISGVFQSSDKKCKSTPDLVVEHVETSSSTSSDDTRKEEQTPSAKLFRHHFQRLGHFLKAQRPEGCTPLSPDPYASDNPSRSQRERVRKELAHVLHLDTFPSQINSNVILSKRRIAASFGEDLDQHQSSSSSVPTCYRCSQSVYPLEKIEPVAGQRYHPQCFRCVVCQSKLTINTFCRSLGSSRDTQIYCRSHQPRQGKVILCKFTTRKSAFPAFKLSWQSSSPPSSSTSSSPNASPFGTTRRT